jgi:hypothetical protein
MNINLQLLSWRHRYIRYGAIAVALAVVLMLAMANVFGGSGPAPQTPDQQLTSDGYAPMHLDGSGAAEDEGVNGVKVEAVIYDPNCAGDVTAYSATAAGYGVTLHCANAFVVTDAPDRVLMNAFTANIISPSS